MHLKKKSPLGLGKGINVQFVSQNYCEAMSPPFSQRPKWLWKVSRAPWHHSIRPSAVPAARYSLKLSSPSLLSSCSFDPVLILGNSTPTLGGLLVPQSITNLSATGYPLPTHRPVVALNVFAAFCSHTMLPFTLMLFLLLERAKPFPSSRFLHLFSLCPRGSFYGSPLRWIIPILQCLLKPSSPVTFTIVIGTTKLPSKKFYCLVPTTA